MSINVTPIPRLIDLAAPAFTLGTANSAGSAVTAVASDATLLAFDATLPDAITFSQSGAVGSATVSSRRDHAHAMEAGTAAAVQSAIEAQTDQNTYIAPDTAVFLNGVLKCTHKMDANAGALVSYNVTGAAKDSTGKYTVTIATDLGTVKATLVNHNSGDSDTTAGINGATGSAYSIVVYTAGSLADKDTNGGMLGIF